MTQSLIPPGRQRSNDLSVSLNNVLSAVRDFQSELPQVNEEHLQTQSAELVYTAKEVVEAHIPSPRPTIGDDLAGLMSAVLAFHIPHSDPELGRVNSLDRLRANKGLLIVSLIEAIDAATRMGMRSQDSPLPLDVSIDLQRGEIDRLLRGVVTRLSVVEQSLNELDSKRRSNTEFAQQNGLLSFYIGSMRTQIDIARLLLSLGDSIDFNSVARSVEVMSQLTQDFYATVQAWALRLTKDILQISQRVRRQVRRVATGIVTAIRVLVRRRQAVVSKLENMISEGEISTELVGDELEAPPSYSTVIARHVPYLRRYARVITGSESRGDSYVAAALEVLAENRKFRRDDNLRVSLYRGFTEIYESLENQASVLPVDHRLPALMTVDLKPRQAFLLVAMEAFAEAEAAEILDVSVDSLQEYIRDAGIALVSNIRTDVLVIEDEEFISMDLVDIVEELGHRVIGVARTHREALSLASQAPPGLIIADIQLADGSSGLDAVNEILTSMEACVIFVTAYPERYLTGERPEPAYLIAKPFRAATLSAVITQILLFEKRAKRIISK